MSRIKKEMRNFIEPILSQFNCGICKQVMHHPTTLLCGDSFCKGCANKQQLSKNVCPTCQTKIGKSDQLIPNITVQNLIYDLPVGCSTPNCAWKGTLDSLQAHISSCNAFKVQKQEKMKTQKRKKVICIDEQKSDPTQILTIDENDSDSDIQFLTPVPVYKPQKKKQSSQSVPIKKTINKNSKNKRRVANRQGKSSSEDEDEDKDKEEESLSHQSSSLFYYESESIEEENSLSSIDDESVSSNELIEQIKKGIEDEDQVDQIEIEGQNVLLPKEYINLEIFNSIDEPMKMDNIKDSQLYFPDQYTEQDIDEIFKQ